MHLICTIARRLSYLHVNKVFAGNLAYSTTDEGLKAFFAPVEGDMYVVSILSLINAC